MGGILETGRSYQVGALAGMARAADFEQKREAENQKLQAAHTSQNISTAASGAVAGAVIGAEMGSAGGPIGAVVGAGIGYLLSEIF